MNRQSESNIPPSIGLDKSWYWVGEIEKYQYF